jgi:hypothetical protein
MPLEPGGWIKVANKRMGKRGKYERRASMKIKTGPLL